MKSIGRDKILPILSLSGGIVFLFVLVPWVVGEKSPFPSIPAIARAFCSEEGKHIPSAFMVTFIKFLAALILGTILGVMIGLLECVSRWALQIISPWLDILRITPAIVWVSLLIFVPFITTPLIPLVLGGLYCALYVALYIGMAVRRISVEELTFMEAQRVPRIWRVRYCYLPRIIAGAATGVRFAGSVALILVVASEAIIRVAGIGHLIVSYMESYSPEPLWATIISLACMALITFYSLNVIADLMGAD